MTKNILFLLIPVFLFINCSTNKNTTNIEATVAGQILVVGNEPFTKLVINSIDNMLYEIKGDSTVYKELWRLQNKNVVLNGKVVKTPLGNNIIVSSYKEQ